MARARRQPADTTPPSPSALPRLYTDLAHLWPLISPPEHYIDEARQLRRILREHLGRRKPRILELGTGGGHTLVHLAPSCDCTAVDLSESMLQNCRALVPSARTFVGDMRAFDLPDEHETFDAVLIHDAIDYLTTRRDLRRTFTVAHRHLRPGGLLIVAPTYLAETFHDHETEHDHHANDDLELTYFSYVHDPNPRDTTFELILIYLIRRKRQVEVVEDRHLCGLFPAETWLKELTAAGFTAELRNNAFCPQFIATRPA